MTVDSKESLFKIEATLTAPFELEKTYSTFLVFAIGSTATVEFNKKFLTYGTQLVKCGW
jgi:hypothetical protein